VVHAQAAVAAGIATATATNPIWLVKTRLQLDASRTAGTTGRRYKSSLDCVRQVVQKEGIGGLYRGLSASYLGTVETALHLVLYEQFKLLCRRALSGTDTQNNAAWSEVIGTTGAAGSAKLAAGLITYPHEAHTPLSLNQFLA